MKYDEKYWEDRFDYMSVPVPDKVKKAIKRVYESYPVGCLPQGICDPLYIMNAIALELGVGDGKGNFFLP